MANLERTIDKILSLDPKLEDLLIPIRVKLKKYPSRQKTYWTQLMKVLNSDGMKKHPRKDEIKEIVTFKRRTPKRKYSIEELLDSDKCISMIPGNLADRIRRYDRATIILVKQKAEVGMTQDQEQYSKLSRMEARLDITSKKIWFDLKDQFNLWNLQGHLTIKRKGDILYLVRVPENLHRAGHMPHPGNRSEISFMHIDPEMLRKLLGGLGQGGPIDEDLTDPPRD